MSVGDVTGLLLPDGRLIELEVADDGLRLAGQEGEVRLAGSFARALARLLETGAPSPMLEVVERRHPWLAGLARARPLVRAHARDALARPLAMLFLELTERCQERCVHCYADSLPERTRMLPAAQARRALEEAAALGADWVQFTGGDPLLHPELPALAAHARALGMGVEIFTNGLALRPGLLARLAPLDVRFSFSIYALDAATHDAITQTPGSLARTLAALARAREAGAEVRAAVVVMEHNERLLTDTVEGLVHAHGLAPENVRVDFVRPVGRGRSVPPASQVRVLHLPTHTSTRGAKLCVAADGRVHPCIFARWLVLGHVDEGLARIVARARARTDGEPAALSCADCRAIVRALEAA